MFLQNKKRAKVKGPLSETNYLLLDGRLDVPQKRLTAVPVYHETDSDSEARGELDKGVDTVTLRRCPGVPRPFTSSTDL